MRVPRIYIETSVFNFYFADDDPEKQQDTIQLFREIGEGRYEPFTSDAVLQELDKAPEPKRSLMSGLVNEYKMGVKQGGDEAEVLADKYVSEGIIPAKYRTDGVHIAITAVYDLDLIVSFNFKHIVKRKTIEMTEVVNIKEGY